MKKTFEKIDSSLSCLGGLGLTVSDPSFLKDLKKELQLIGWKVKVNWLWRFGLSNRLKLTFRPLRRFKRKL